MTAVATKPAPKRAAKLAEPGRIPLLNIEPHPLNPRQEFKLSELEQLVETMKTMGLLEPIVVRPLEGKRGRYQLIAGERRFRAARLAKWIDIPAIVRDVSDADALAMQLVENLQRVDLNPIEKARGLNQLCLPVEECGAGKTHHAVAEMFGHAPSWATNLIRLLKLPDAWQAKLLKGELTESQGRLLVRFADKPAILARIEADMTENPWFYRTREDFQRSIDAFHKELSSQPDAPASKWSGRVERAKQAKRARDGKSKQKLEADAERRVLPITIEIISRETTAGEPFEDAVADVSRETMPANENPPAESTMTQAPVGRVSTLEIIAAIGAVESIEDLERIMEAAVARREALAEVNHV